MPADIVARLVEAINRGDVDAAIALYESDAVMVVKPGEVARGTERVRQALAGFIALKPTLRMEGREVVEAGDVALYLGRWSLRGTDPAGKPVEMGGESSDILRRQDDGRWLIAVDNPWGTQLVRRG
jgi:uncharacterized protein (TIGR02246 family)